MDNVIDIADIRKKAREKERKNEEQPSAFFVSITVESDSGVANVKGIAHMYNGEHFDRQAFREMMEHFNEIFYENHGNALYEWFNSPQKDGE